MRWWRRFRKRVTGNRHAAEEQLQDQLRKKVTELKQGALENSGDISAEQLASTERLARVVRLADESKPPERWPAALALVLALVLISLLMLVRMSETEVTLDAAVTELSFTLPAEKPVVARSGVVQIGVSGMNNVEISPNAIPELSDVRTASTIRLSVISNSLPGSGISTATLIPPSGTKLWLSYAGAPRSYRLSLKPPRKGAKVSLNAEVCRELEVAATDVLPGARKFDFGKSGATFAFGSSDGIMDMDLVLNPASDLRFYAQVPVENLNLFRIEEFSLPGRTLVNPASTLLSGTLYLESLNGEKHELRAGEQIRFGRSKGRIESLKLEGDRITFKFRGRVGGMNIGEENIRRNLMPNLLEWLKARQPLTLLWGGTLFLYGLLFSIIKWWHGQSR